ncbi:glycosyltransferase family 2 protein [Coprococcus sp. AF21-14LB]|uniref:glycosyltransferase family 2 protein n=1 Tax=Coprococcus sp. AF21-14LB TaxID=2292231 RepID=UPI000E4A7158|nr:glycosyltransferase [Coprococcus sp. AF21-14LB]RGS75648.1 glycosyltransferase [Coprococcus sp. AF21-14LB]
MQPLVSIIIPVYNAERFLRETLDSLVEQTYKHFEVICVDDGSTDKSLEILREYNQKDSRFRFIEQNNQYAGVARNNGLKVACGKYIMFLDSDDLFEKKMLFTLVKIAERKKIDILFFWILSF